MFEERIEGKTNTTVRSFIQMDPSLSRNRSYLYMSCQCRPYLSISHSLRFTESFVPWTYRWASQEDENLRKEGLREGLPLPDLATIKDFIRFYIFSSNGMISLRPTKLSVLNFAERSLPVSPVLRSLLLM